MTLSPEDARVIDEVYTSLSEPDLDRFVACFTADGELHDLPDMPGERVYKGHEGLRQWAESRLELADAWEWRLEEILADEGGTVVSRAHVEIQGHGSGLTVEMDVFHVAVLRDGHIAKVMGFSRRDEAFEAAGLS